MARIAKFPQERIVEATARLAAREGPAQATMARIADELGAPTGSIYHRFASRDVLLGEVWLGAAESFQREFGACLKTEPAWQAGLDAVLFVPARVREQPDEARILMLHRREDFLGDGWPAPLAERAQALMRSADGGLRAFAQRLLGRSDAPALRAVRYVIVDAPLAAILPHLRAGERLPATLETLLRATYAAVIAELGVAPPRPNRRKTP